MKTDAAKKQRILLVDDEEHLLVTVRDFLTFQGYVVELARSGEEALQALDAMMPDLIILDISMPGIGGMGFLQRLGHVASPPPVLVLTARSNLRSFFDGLDVAGFVSKPCEKAVLLKEVERILKNTVPVQAEHARKGPIHVLLAEDDAEVRGVLDRMMKRHGHTVTHVDSGPAVLEVVLKAGVDVVVLKQFLTQLNGAAVADLLRTMPSTRNLPVILYDVVGVGSRSTRPHDGHLSAVDRYVEVLDCNEIVEAMEEVLRAN